MAVKMDAKKKKLFLFGGIGVGVIAAVVVILLVTGVLTHSALYRKLAADGTATIEINEDIDVNEMLVVNGDKTLVGNGTIHAKKGEYAIVINSNAKLTINGPTVDCDGGATNGIYTSEGATFAFDAGAIKNTAGHGVRVLGTSTFAGGNIDTVGTNWLMIDENAAATITKGEFKDADEIGIISGANSTLDISGDVTLDTAIDNLVYAAGTTNINGGTYTGHIDYAFYNSGVMNISNITMSGAKGLGYIQNAAGAKMNLNNVAFLDSKTDFIYNLGIFNGENVVLGDCVNSAIENTGKKASLTLKNAVAGKIGASFILNKNANVTLEDVEVEETTAYVVYNRAANLNASGIKVGKVGGTAFLNDFVDAKSQTSIGVMNIDDFEIGEVALNGLRSNGGSVKLSNGTFDICQNHALYIKDGKLDCDTVKFAGAAATKVVIQVGYKTTLTAKAEFKNCDITGGARGLVNYATTTITNSNFHDIQAAGSYKAGAALKNSGTMTITGTKFTGNRALSSGGAVYNVGKLTLGSGNVFSGNSSATSGGAIANGKAGTLKITGGTITNNRATNYAGGIYNSGTLSFSGATVSGNYATKGGGGIENTGSASISGGTFSNNRSGATGGGIYNGSKGTMTISGVTVSGNSSSSDKSAGGVYNLGKMTIKSGSFTGNTAGTYGGAISNGVNTSGTVRGNLTITGGKFNGNTAIANAGGALYNRGDCVIAGGNFNGNSINSEKNGKNIYNSGELTIKGGTANDASEKPYDIYTFKGNVNFSGSPAIGSIYKAADSTVTIAGALTPSSQIKFYMGSYVFGQRAFCGSSSNIASYKQAFDLSHHDVSTTSTESVKYVDNNGYINAPYAEEAELWRNGEKLATTFLSIAASSAQHGDTIRIIGDVSITEYIGLTCFSKSTIDAYKTLYVTGDGKEHTISIDTGSDCGFYIAASSGDGGTGTSESGYYRSSVYVDMDATGLTFEGQGDMGSAAFYVSGPATLNLTGGIFKNFSNVATEPATEEQTHSTGKNGGVMSIGASATVDIEGSTFTNNSNAGSGGGAIYCNGKLNINKSGFYNNSTAEGSGKNGGAIYVSSTGKLNSKESLFYGNEANNGGAVYVYGSEATFDTDVFMDNVATGTASTSGQALYQTSTKEEVHSSVALKGVITTGAGDGEYGVYVKSGNKITLEGQLSIDNLKVEDTPVMLTSSVTGKSVITIPENLYVGDGKTRVFEGTTTGCNEAFKVNDGSLLLDDNGYLVGKIYRAAIGDTQYETIDDALNAAGAGDTIKLLKNVKYDSSDRSSTRTKATVINKNITLDLNGYVLTSEGKYQMFRVESGAIFTLKDSVGTGKVAPGEGSFGGRFVTVVSGTFNMESGLITGGSTTSSTGGGAVNVSANGVFNMSGGEISNCSATKMAGAVALLGTFNFTGGEIKDCTQTTGAGIDKGGEGTTGTLKVSGTAKLGVTYNVPFRSFDGGYFQEDVTSDCAYGFKCVADTTFAPTYTYKVEEDPTINKTVSVNGTEYYTFDLAMKAVSELSGNITVKLLDNCTQSNPESGDNIIAGQNVTIDLNGYTLDGSHQRSMFAVASGATLTITDTSVGANGVIKNTSASNSGAIATVKGTLNLNAGTMTGVTSGSGQGGAVRVWNDATFNMTGGKITGSSAPKGGAVYVGGSSNAGTFNMTGGEITGNTTTNNTSADIFVTYSASVLSIANSKDMDSRVNASIEFAQNVAGAGNQITGGYFATNKATVAEGYEFEASTKYPGYSYRVVSKTKVAEIGEVKYVSLDEALEAANGMTSATIKMLTDVTDFSGNYEVSGNVTLDLQGHTITPVSTAAGVFRARGKLTVTDTVGGGKVSEGIYTVFGQDSGIVIIEGKVTIDATNSGSVMGGLGKIYITGEAKIIATSFTSQFTITGGYFTTDVSSYLTSDYKCVADTTYEGFGYKVKTVDGYEQPGGTDGKDITDVDKFDETEPAPPQ